MLYKKDRKIKWIDIDYIYKGDSVCKYHSGQGSFLT